ncbi:hypothetical protein D8S78_17440 [Natrialba swarupiae]|nr:hypothetical protein [Natrialba swarupiae]
MIPQFRLDDAVRLRRRVHGLASTDRGERRSRTLEAVTAVGVGAREFPDDVEIDVRRPGSYGTADRT